MSYIVLLLATILQPLAIVLPRLAPILLILAFSYSLLILASFGPSSFGMCLAPFRYSCANISIVLAKSSVLLYDLASV